VTGVLAYKWLADGGRGPFSGFRWPCPESDDEPGEWVRIGSDLSPCRSGVHACTLPDLPMWLSDELWLVELSDPVERGPRQLVASAGRLRARVGGWSPSTAVAFAQACAHRVAEHVEAGAQPGYAQDAAAYAERAATGPLLMADVCCVGFIAAHAARDRGGLALLEAERAWQAEWLARRLEL
jgi:hypothetical protein